MRPVADRDKRGPRRSPLPSGGAVILGLGPMATAEVVQSGVKSG